MKLVFAEERIQFLENEIQEISSWLDKRTGIPQNRLKEFISKISSNLSEISSLQFRVEKTKAEKAFDDKLSIREAELFRDELLLRAKINQNIAVSVTKNKEPEVDVDSYYFQSEEIRKLASDITQKICLLKYTEDLV